MLYIDDLKTVIREGTVLIEPQALEPYATDASPGLHASPCVVVIPATEEEVRQVLLISHRYNIPIVPRGAGTGTTGGAIPLDNAIVISFERMNRILEIDQANKMAVVQPGVITGVLQDKVEAVGLFYPPDPASLATCTIGGNVAENSGGPRALKYGITGNYVIGLSGFLADGTPFEAGGKRLKDVAGYDLVSLLVGSEGTLAVITRITLRLLALPAYQQDILITFDDDEAALGLLQQVYQARIQPSTAEFMDRTCLEAVEAAWGTRLAYSDSQAQLIFQVDGWDKRAVFQEAVVIQSLAEKMGAKQVIIAVTPEERREIWTVRRALSGALKKLSPEKISHDISVPPSRIIDYMQAIRRLSRDTGVKILGYGHLGDGNIHVNILKDAQENWLELTTVIIDQIFRTAVDMGGTITGEHGVGLTKKAYLKLMLSPAQYHISKQIKRAFDPKGLLNPGKIFE